MSFSFNAKLELCRNVQSGKCCAVAECYGAALYCNTFSQSEIRIITGNPVLGRHLLGRFESAFSFSFDVFPGDEAIGKQAYIISDRDKLAKVFETYGYSSENIIAHRVNLGVLEEDCCRVSFIRGAFLTGGAVTNPEKSYHLELVTAHYSVSRQTYSLLLEMGFSPKEIRRGGNFIVYFKQSAAIEDFLTLIGAPLAAMELMSAKIEKDVRNTVNRKVNCDTANVTKTVDAAAAQIEAINRLEAAGMVDSLSDKLKQTALLRMQNPELSITQLAEISTPPLTKSCLNHRLRKLVQLAGGNSGKVPCQT